MEAEAAMWVKDEDLIDIQEEADLMQSERIIDDFDPREAGRRSADAGDAMRMLEKMMLSVNLDEEQIIPIQLDESSTEWEVNSWAGWKKV